MTNMTNPELNEDDVISSISFEIIKVQPAKQGRLLALVDASIYVNSVEFMVCGFRVEQTKTPEGKPAVMVLSPLYRDARGSWAAAVCLPPEIIDPLSQEILDRCLLAGICETAPMG